MTFRPPALKEPTMTRRILIVEDDAETRAYLAKGLGEAGYLVETTGSGREGLYLATGGGFDALLLDRMLPDLDGLSLLKSARAAGVAAPAILLTAMSATDERVRGLRAGADDYLVKPFAFTELLARVRSLLRRGRGGLEPTILKIADLELDILRRRASRAGQRVDLTAKEFALLELFLRHQGEVLPRSLIASQVWDMNFDSDTNVIDVAVRRLRLKVDDGHGIKLIHTARGMGYVLEQRREDGE